MTGGRGPPCFPTARPTRPTGRDGGRGDSSTFTPASPTDGRPCGAPHGRPSVGEAGVKVDESPRPPSLPVGRVGRAVGKQGGPLPPVIRSVRHNSPVGDQAAEPWPETPDELVRIQERLAAVPFDLWRPAGGPAAARGGGVGRGLPPPRRDGG